MIKDRRRGIFFLDMTFLERSSTAELLALFSGVIALEARSNWATGKIEYWAISSHFEEVPPECVLPEYVPVLTRLNDGAYSVRWLKDGVEPEPEPIVISEPDWGRVSLSVDYVINKYRMMDPIGMDPDEFTERQDWLNPFIESRVCGLQTMIRETINCDLDGGVTMCHRVPFCWGLSPASLLVMENGPLKRHTIRLSCGDDIADYLVNWVRLKWGATGPRDRVHFGRAVDDALRARKDDRARQRMKAMDYMVQQQDRLRNMAAMGIAP